jgi:replication factor C subunit 1
VLMDEVDGVGGGDRGGLSALLQIIKKTKVPIVLICNDRGDRRI